MLVAVVMVAAKAAGVVFAVGGDDDCFGSALPNHPLASLPFVVQLPKLVDE